MTTFIEFLAEQADKKPANIDNLIHQGIDKLLRIRALGEVDAFDIISALESVRDVVKDTKSLKGKKLRQDDKGKELDFDFIEHVKKELGTLFLHSPDADEKRAKKKLNRAMYNILLMPIVDKFKSGSHDEMLDGIDSTIDGAIKAVKTSDVEELSKDEAWKERVKINKEMSKKTSNKQKAKAISKMRDKTKKKAAK